jgi:hypothetical protein
MADLARAGGIDVLTGDYLAEVTMLILGKARAKDSTKGYATTFLQHLDAALEHLVANGIRLVVNAGGLNPAGLAAATRELIARHGHDLRVSHIEGDDVSAASTLSSRRAFAAAPDERRTAVVLAASAADGQRVPGRIRHRARPRARCRHRHHRPRRRRLTGRRPRRLVVGVGAGRLRRPRRCGRRRARHRMRATGDRRQLLRVSLHPDSTNRVPDRRDRRRRLVGDHQGPGDRRAVTTDTVTAQLIYEIGAPAYLNPT